jgi:hypothetical protein
MLTADYPDYTDTAFTTSICNIRAIRVIRGLSFETFLPRITRITRMGTTWCRTGRASRCTQQPPAFSVAGGTGDSDGRFVADAFPRRLWVSCTLRCFPSWFRRKPESVRMLRLNAQNLLKSWGMADEPGTRNIQASAVSGNRHRAARYLFVASGFDLSYSAG